MRTVVPAALPFLDKNASILALIKPQFEAGRKQVARGKGVVRDPEIHRQVLMDVLSFAIEAGFDIKGLARSPILGPKGNVEFLGWLGISKLEPTEFELEELISTVIEYPE